MRLFQVAHDPRCSKSGVYWSWNGGPREGRGAEALEKDGQISGGGGAGGGWDSIYENDQSDKVLNRDTAAELWKHSSIVTGADWPPANQPTSPCPTLKVVAKLTELAYAKEEAKRIKPAPGNVVGLGLTPVDSTVKVVDSRVLGELPATGGSFQEEAGDAPKKNAWRRIWRLRRRPPKEELALPAAAPLAAVEDAIDIRLNAALDPEGKLPLDGVRARLEACITGEECDLSDAEIEAEIEQAKAKLQQPKLQAKLQSS